MSKGICHSSSPPTTTKVSTRTRTACQFLSEKRISPFMDVVDSLGIDEEVSPAKRPGRGRPLRFPARLGRLPRPFGRRDLDGDAVPQGRWRLGNDLVLGI